MTEIKIIFTFKNTTRRINDLQVNVEIHDEDQLRRCNELSVALNSISKILAKDKELFNVSYECNEIEKFDNDRSLHEILDSWIEHEWN